MKKIHTKTKIYILLLALILVVISLFYFRKPPVLPQALEQANIYKCPESYTEDDIGTKEYRDSLIGWSSSFFEANPKADISDWSMAKSQLWRENNCIVALERSKLSGEVSDLKPWELVDYEIQNALDTAINSTN